MLLVTDDPKNTNFQGEGVTYVRKHKEDLEKLKTFLTDNGIGLSFSSEEENYR